MTWQKRDQVFGCADRPGARPATTMGDGKSFMQIEMADVSTDFGRVGQST